MAKNKMAREWGAMLIREVHDRAINRGGYVYELSRLARVGAGKIDKVSSLANSLGFRLAIQPPEEAGSGNWYTMGGKWRDQLKTMVFHFLERENAELIAEGRREDVDLIVRKSKLRDALHDSGLCADVFTEWLKYRNPKVPSMESFCILAMFEGFGLEWREIPLKSVTNG